MKIFSELNVHAFSETDVRGFKNEKYLQSEANNWFGSEEAHYESIANFSFVEEEKANRILEEVAQFNKTIDCCSPMHAFMLNVEKTV